MCQGLPRARQSLPKPVPSTTKPATEFNPPRFGAGDTSVDETGSALVCRADDRLAAEEHRPRWGARPSKPSGRLIALGGFDSCLFRKNRVLVASDIASDEPLLATWPNGSE